MLGVRIQRIALWPAPLFGSQLLCSQDFTVVNAQANLRQCGEFLTSARWDVPAEYLAAL